MESLNLDKPPHKRLKQFNSTNKGVKMRTAKEIQNIAGLIDKVILKYCLDPTRDIYYNIYWEYRGKPKEHPAVECDYKKVKEIMDSSFPIEYMTRKQWNELENDTDFLYQFEREVHKVRAKEINWWINEDSANRLADIWLNKMGHDDVAFPICYQKENERNVWLAMTPDEVRAKIQEEKRIEEAERIERESSGDCDFLKEI